MHVTAANPHRTEFYQNLARAGIRRHWHVPDFECARSDEPNGFQSTTLAADCLPTSSTTAGAAARSSCACAASVAATPATVSATAPVATTAAAIVSATAIISTATVVSTAISAPVSAAPSVVW